jgi:hypothetical protein
MCRYNGRGYGRWGRPRRIFPFWIFFFIIGGFFWWGHAWAFIIPMLIILGIIFMIARMVMRSSGMSSWNGWQQPWQGQGPYQQPYQPPYYQPSQPYQQARPAESVPYYTPPQQQTAEADYAPYDRGYVAPAQAAPAPEQPYSETNNYEQPQASYPEMMPPMEQQQ